MHPMLQDLTSLSNEELHKKYNDLVSKYNQAHRSGPTSIIPQLQMLMSSYQEEMDNRNRKIMSELEEKDNQFKGIIDIK